MQPEEAAAAEEAARAARNRGNWDKLPQAGEIVAQQKSTPNWYPKKRRECYCGNLNKDMVTSTVLWQALNRLFQSLPAFRECYPDVPDPVRSLAFPSNGQGMFAFVEFCDEVIASTAICMSGFELCGRPVKVGRPQGYQQAHYGELPPLDVQPLRQCGMLPVAAEFVSVAVSHTVTSKLKELYFGNLTLGLVTEEVMTELLTPACLELPEYMADAGPPIVKVTMATSGTYCFGQFQSAAVASRVIAIFDNTELFGRRMRVGRPSNYHLNFQAETPALPAPPEQKAAEPTEAFLAGAAAVAGLQL